MSWGDGGALVRGGLLGPSGSAGSSGRGARMPFVHGLECSKAARGCHDRGALAGGELRGPAPEPADELGGVEIDDPVLLAVSLRELAPDDHHCLDEWRVDAFSDERFAKRDCAAAER